LSSAILYLAIVAIWACVLVPRWLHRSHDHSAGAEIPAGSEGPGQPGEADQGFDGGLADNPDFATQREQGGVAGSYADPVAWENPVEAGALWGSVEGSDSGSGSGSVEATYSVTAEEATYSATAEYAEYSEYTVTASYSAEASDSDASAYRAAQGPPTTHPGHVAHGSPGGHGGPGGHGSPGGHGGPGGDRSLSGHGDQVAGRRHPPVPVRPPGPAPHVLQARRRTLTMIIAITIGIMGAAFVGLTPWWTAVPPFVMLGLYLLLLHEASHADAEQARWHAEARAQSLHAARAAHAARLRARQAQAAPLPQPTAEIIDISARAASADQLYDQYADAEIRAVGD
jgi:hypothetical protein